VRIVHLARGGRDRLIEIPPQLAGAVEEDEDPIRVEWLARLPKLVAEVASDWRLELGDPYLPGGQCAWVAPARGASGEELALKVSWRHREAEHEADALRLWDGEGAVRCFRARSFEDTAALLLERCVPGVPLQRALPEPEQDSVIAGLLLRLWSRQPPAGHPFGSLEAICQVWAQSFELDYATDSGGLDRGLANEGMAALRELPRSAERTALLATDLHADNVLSARRAPWLTIDPKPFVGDPAFDPVQHMLNCEERLAADPDGLTRRMAELLDLDPARVRWWLFARCVQESIHDLPSRVLARRLAP
jgi:streptomycin 6-kinase